MLPRLASHSLSLSHSLRRTHTGTHLNASATESACEEKNNCQFFDGAPKKLDEIAKSKWWWEIIRKENGWTNTCWRGRANENGKTHDEAWFPLIYSNALEFLAIANFSGIGVSRWPNSVYAVAGRCSKSALETIAILLFIYFCFSPLTNLIHDRT